MAKDSKVVLSALAKLMEKEGITVSATHLHVEFFDDKGEKLQYPRDKWYILIEYQGKTFGGFYHTGIGLRIPFGYGKQKVRHERGRYYIPSTGEWLTDAEAIKRRYLSLPKEGPRIDYIMQAFLTDASGAEESFKEWCSTFGQNADSISHLMIYLRCQETRDALLRMFGGKLMSQLMEAGRDL